MKVFSHFQVPRMESEQQPSKDFFIAVPMSFSVIGTRRAVVLSKEPYRHLQSTAMAHAVSYKSTYGTIRPKWHYLTRRTEDMVMSTWQCIAPALMRSQPLE